MFRKMRRADRQIVKEEAEQILKEAEYGTLGTICENGYPYAVPLSFVYLGECIYFHCATTGHKLDNIVRDNKVSFCTVTDTQVQPSAFSTKYKSVVVFGSASIASEDEKRIALLGLINKYSPGFLEKGKQYISQSLHETKIVKIEIAYMSGKAKV